MYFGLVRPGVNYLLQRRTHLGVNVNGRSPFLVFGRRIVFPNYQEKATEDSKRLVEGIQMHHAAYHRISNLL